MTCRSVLAVAIVRITRQPVFLVVVASADDAAA
jgi:hypothetical protein